MVGYLWIRVSFSRGPDALPLTEGLPPFGNGNGNVMPASIVQAGQSSVQGEADRMNFSSFRSGAPPLNPFAGPLPRNRFFDPDPDFAPEPYRWVDSLFRPVPAVTGPSEHHRTPGKNGGREG